MPVNWMPAFNTNTVDTGLRDNGGGTVLSRLRGRAPERLIRAIAKNVEWIRRCPAPNGPRNTEEAGVRVYIHAAAGERRSRIPVRRSHGRWYSTQRNTARNNGVAHLSGIIFMR